KNALDEAEDREDDEDLGASFLSNTVTLPSPSPHADALLDDDEERFSDNEHPPSARAISHRSLANHDNMEQWRSLLEGYEETAAMVVGYKLLTAGTAWAPSVKSIIGRVSCPTWIFIESSNGAEV
ncbi:hypothetical protein DXG01_015690, partial [Tephrocybe rancida]